MSDKITFKQLVELIAKQSKQSESSANSFIHELVQIIESGLKSSGSVSISGFGKFELRWMKERPGVNPQTGDEITIPGQNKVVFKPYKALRETVNKPFANLKSEILPEKVDSEKNSEEDKSSKDSDDPFGLNDIFSTEEPTDSKAIQDDSADSSDPFDLDSDPDVPFDSDDPFGIDKKAKSSNLSQDYNKYIDDLIFEKENPHFGRSESKSVAEEEEEDGDILVLEREKEEDEKEEKQKISPSIPDESKMARKVQESGSFKWSYAAAVIIVMVALILLFWMMQRSGDSIEETATTGTETQNQTEQVVEPSTTESETENAGGAAATGESTAGNETSQPTADEESPPTAAQTQSADELDTQSFTIESGQSLWDIAENQLGNPYLWPVIYHLNQNELSNPNQLLANSDIEIPTFSDPDNLNEFEREQVALGYFSLYQWNRENNPDEARYFLWAVGVFSQDLLDQPPSEVDPQDLAFARNR